jgi:hypothetical protein
MLISSSSGGVKMALKPQNQTSKTMTFGSHSELEKVITKTNKKEAKLQVLCDEDLKLAFKLACVKEGTDMSSVVIGLIKGWMKDKS